MAACAASTAVEVPKAFRAAESADILSPNAAWTVEGKFPKLVSMLWRIALLLSSSCLASADRYGNNAEPSASRVLMSEAPVTSHAWATALTVVARSVSVSVAKDSSLNAGALSRPSSTHTKRMTAVFPSCSKSVSSPVLSWFTYRAKIGRSLVMMCRAKYCPNVVSTGTRLRRRRTKGLGLLSLGGSWSVTYAPGLL